MVGFGSTEYLIELEDLSDEEIAFFSAILFIYVLRWV